MTHWRTNRGSDRDPEESADETATSGLEARIPEHRELLDQSIRRVQQLLGERQQLRARLAERDERIEELSREIGALTASGARGVVPNRQSMPWSQAGRHVQRRFFAFFGGRSTDRHRVAVRSAEGEATPLAPAARRVPLYGDRAMLAILAVLVFGLSHRDLERVVETVTDGQGSQAVLPLFLTDDDDFSAMRARRALFEYLPARIIERSRESATEGTLYVQRRLALIRRKWRPARAVAFGRVAADVLDLWRSSPFEDDDIQRLVGSGLSGDAGEAAGGPVAARAALPGVD